MLRFLSNMLFGCGHIKSLKWPYSKGFDWNFQYSKPEKIIAATWPANGVIFNE
jgi:hypothetical protein